MRGPESQLWWLLYIAAAARGEGPASLRQCDFPVKGISHRVYLCVHMQASSHVRVFIKAADYAEHCCRQEERKGGERK